jgi:exopolysaccharide biosynthesis polyprenyl glycosylphosphotransferase
MLNPKLGYRFNGFIDVHHSANSNLADDRVCDLDGFQEYVRNNIVDEIFLFLPIKSFYDELSKVIAICEEQGIIVRMQPDIFELRFAKARVEQIGWDTMLTLYTGNMNRGSILVKEIFDVVAAFILIILTSPVMLIAALLVKLSSPGPVFFLQERMGLHKRKFKIIKFRTMYRDAEQRIEEFAHLNEMGTNGAFKIKNDPRITPVGKILRALSIDELPQFFNILKGEMSLIGPRPLTVRDFKGFEIDQQRRRFSVKPGLTCLWQISGRSNISFDEWMALDMEYIDNWSLGLDIKIFFKTIFTVLKAEGAH